MIDAHGRFNAIAGCAIHGPNIAGKNVDIYTCFA
jgi:hypothetical protein